MCEGGEVNVSATLLSGVPSKVTFTQTPAGGATTEAKPAADYVLKDIPTTTTTYEVSMSGTLCNGNVSRSVEVEVEKPANLTLTASASAVCEGESVDLTLANPTAANVEWQSSSDGNLFAADVSIVSGTGQTPDKATWYRVKSKGEKICTPSITQAVKVAVEKPVVFTLAQSEKAICNGEEVSVEMNLTQGTPRILTLTRTTSDGSKEESWTENSLTEAPALSTNYKVTAMGDVCKTPVEHEVDVEVQQPATLELMADKNSICENEEVTFTLKQTNAKSVNWQTSENGRTFNSLDIVADAAGVAVLKPKKTAYYKVTAVGAEACPGSETEALMVAVEDSIRFELTQPAGQLVCAGTQVGSAVVLTSGNPTAYTWEKQTADGTTPIGTSTQMSDVPKEKSAYFATVTGQKCPAVKRSFEVEVEIPASIESFKASAAKVCRGGEVTLSISQQNAKELLWEQMVEGGAWSLMNNELTSEQTVEVTAETAYRVSTAGAVVCGNKMSQVVSVNVADSVKVTLPADTTVCPGQEVALVATVKGMPKVVRWTSSADGAIFAPVAGGGATQTVQPAQSTVYRVVAVGDGCPDDEAEMKVSVEEVPDISLAASADSVCEGTEVTLNATFVQDGEIIYESRFADQKVWSEMGNGGESLVFAPERTLVYRAKGVTKHGCQAVSGDVMVTVDEPIVGVVADTFICEGSDVTLRVTGTGGSYKYAWSTADSVWTNKPALKVTPKETTAYMVEITNGKCKETMEQTVEVLPLPYFTAIEDLDVRELNFVAESGTGAYEYDFGRGWTSNSVFSEFHFGTTYKAMVRDAKGCMGDTTFTTSTYQIKIPAFFTPNGDADNELFEIENIGKYPDAKISIYDRWGKLLVESTGGEYEGWDGTYNGHPLPSTDYWYEIYVHEIGKTYTGHFTLLRK